MSWLKRLAGKFLICYIADYVEKGVKVDKKAGIRSTEFWMALSGVVLVFLNEQLELNLPVSSIVSIATMILSYIASRTWLKAKGQA